ncbi:ATP-binding cassette sub-family A member 10-like [Lissotriton helveticus]
MLRRQVSVCQQTGALLYKNLLIKWRNKTQILQEWILCAAVLFIVWFLTFATEMYPMYILPVPENIIGRLDECNITGRVIGYAPKTENTEQIMEKVSLTLSDIGIRIEGFENETALTEASNSNKDLLGIVFKNSFSYEVRLSQFFAPIPIDHYGMFDCEYHSDFCSASKYWLKGFVFLQASIDAAIIEVKTNHSVWNELKSAIGIVMKFHGTFLIDPLTHGAFTILLSMVFFPLLYFMTLNVAREKEKHKELLRMMGLRDMSFWLSWCLLYAGFIFIMASLLAVIITNTLLLDSSYLVIFLLFFLYGIASMCFCFLLISLLRKPKLTSIVGFLLTLTFGCLSLILLIDELPSPVMWILNIFLSPFSFSTGLSQVVFLENAKEGIQLNNLSEGPYPMVAVFSTLMINAVFYILMATYFDEVLPNTYGGRRSPFFFLNSSYWSTYKKSGIEVVSDIVSNGESASDFIEAVTPEFRGKEAIRINNVNKIYHQKDTHVEALKGLQFDVYEGQITALLGHSGSGKTTLLNILSGLCPLSDGVVSIYNHRVSEMEDALQTAKNTTVGFCPQFDVKFDALTVKENLRLFANVRGIPSKEVDREVQNVLNGLDITNIQDVRAASLSGGQRRKLTLGISILGDPQVLFLDEPTAGLDPCSRHHVWTLLKERKAGRVTLFSTQFMDEADILADRKAVLSKGRLKCVGTSMFLKRKWGIGYHLRMHVADSCNAEDITSIVKYHIPSGKLLRQHEQDMIYTLPFDSIDSFPDLFSDLDIRTGQNTTTYGVSMTTLEDVFLKLEGDQAIEQTDYGVFSQEQMEEEKDDGVPDEMEQTLLSLSETGKATVNGLALWRQQVLAIARVRVLKLKNESKALRSIVLILIIYALPMLIHISLYHSRGQLGKRELTPDLYLLHPGEQPYKRFTNLLIQNNTGSEIDDFVNSIKSQNIMVDVTNGNNSDQDVPYNLVLMVSREEKSYRFALSTSIQSINGYPVLMNIISNAFLRNFSSTERIRIWNNVFLEDIGRYFWIAIYAFSAFFMGILGAIIPPYIGMSSVYDNKIKVLSQLRLSGLFPSAYWCGQAMVDIPLFWLLLMIMAVILKTFTVSNSLTPVGWTELLICLTGYSASAVLLVYVISFVFRKGRNNPDFWACIFLVVSVIGFIIEIIAAVHIALPYLTPILLSVFLPVFPLLGCIIRLEDKEGIDRNIFNRENHSIIIPTVVPYLHCIVFLLLLRCLEMRYGKKIFKGDPVFRIPPKNDRVCSNLDEPKGDEESVEAERTLVMEIVSGQRTKEDSAIVASSLRKEYKDKKASSVFRKKKKVATQNISFCVKKGEILGLLGPNGAGKSTTIRMLTGDTKPTAGQVLLTELQNAPTSQRERYTESTAFLGYCPQENALWPGLTVEQHLAVYAAVKGMRKEDAAVAIKRVTDALELNEHLKITVKKLPEGVKRKLCFTISMLANPQVVLLDEPSTGLDPKGQQRVWRAIRAAFKNKDRGAILTTHYMQEAEAVCDRVAIMVSGNLRCIGSIQQLKSKFGKGYFLEIKVRDQQQVDALHLNILKIFPHAARQERFSSLLSYKIPMDNVKSLSQAFSALEEVKRTFNLEEYSFSQSTLEQVFLELTKEQEKDDFDMALDSTYEWKQLQEEDV